MSSLYYHQQRRQRQRQQEQEISEHITITTTTSTTTVEPSFLSLDNKKEEKVKQSSKPKSTTKKSDKMKKSSNKKTSTKKEGSNGVVYYESNNVQVIDDEELIIKKKKSEKTTKKFSRITSAATTTTVSDEEKPSSKKKKSKKISTSSTSSSTPDNNTTETKKKKTKKTMMKKKKKKKKSKSKSKKIMKMSNNKRSTVSIDPTDIKLCIASSSGDDEMSNNSNVDWITSLKYDDNDDNDNDNDNDNDDIEKYGYEDNNLEDAIVGGNNIRHQTMQQQRRRSSTGNNSIHSSGIASMLSFGSRRIMMGLAGAGGGVGRRIIARRRNSNSRRIAFAATKGSKQNQNFRITTNPNAMKVQRLEAYFYNHGMEIALYILFISMQILVGCYGAYQFTPMGGYHTENKILKYTLPIARAGGRLVTFNCALLLITACKYCWTLIRTYIAPIIPIGFPIDNIMPKYHKTVAYWIIVMGCFTHTIPQIVNYSTKSIILENKFRAWTFGNGFATTQLLITGTLLALIFSTFYITTLPFFRKTATGFRWFWFFHMGGVATAYPLLILHGTCRGHPIFLYIQLLPLLLYLFDISMRKSKTKTTNVLEWTCHEDNGEHITELVIECPSNFNYTPGQYCELKFSPISANEWHPFTIASAPTDDDDIDDLDNDIEAGISSPTKKKLVFYIKSTGRWTEALYNYASAFDLNKAMKPTEISIRGPHGAPAMNYFEYRHIIVIGSGIGVTPLISIWKYLIHKAATRTTTQSESRTSTLTQNGSSSIELGKSLEGSILTFDTSLSSSELLSKDEEVYNDELLNNEQQQQKTMLRKVSVNIEKILESMTVSMFLLCFFVMGETIAIVMQMFKFSAFANLFGSFLSITALLIHGCNIIVSTIVLGPCIYIRLFKFWLELCIIIVDSFALWISMIGYMYYNPTNDYNSSNHISRATNTTYFYFFGVVVVLHAIRIFHIFYTTLKPTKDNNTTVTTTTTTTTTTNNHNGNQICSIQGILINKYYSGMRFAAKSLIPPIGSKLFSMEFYGTREKPKDDDDNEDSDSDSESEEIITDLMGSSEFKRISLHKKNQNLNLNNNNRKSKIKQDDCLSFKCGRPDWRQIFLKAMAKAHNSNSNSNSNSNARGSCGESVGVFFCGSPAIAADLQTMAKEVTAQHQFAKKHLDGKACKCKLIVHSENF